MINSYTIRWEENRLFVQPTQKHGAELYRKNKNENPRLKKKVNDALSSCTERTKRRMNALKRGLIVSCQAVKGEPLYGYGIMHLFAKAAKEGGATGIRALCDDIDSIKDEVNLPTIGLVKEIYEDSEIYITPTQKEIDNKSPKRIVSLLFIMDLFSFTIFVRLTKIYSYENSSYPRLCRSADARRSLQQRQPQPRPCRADARIA